MRAAFYTRQGPAREVLQIGEQPTPQPAELVPGPAIWRIPGQAFAEARKD